MLSSYLTPISILCTLPLATISMTTNSKVFDDSSSIATAPPSYDKISANPIQCNQSSIFSFRRMKQKRAAVLSRIRDIVLAPNFNPSSVTPNLNACAAALPAAEFSNILTHLNIEGHTALCWAIVNNRPQAFWAFEKFISGSTYSSVCASDLCIAFMITSNNAMFAHLSSASTIEDRRLRSCLGCPPDEIRVHTCDEPTNQFNVVMRIRIFQKRLRTITGNRLQYEFVAGGRMWWFRFALLKPSNGLWSAEIGLCQHSHPARLDAVLLIEAHSRKPGRATPPEALKIPLTLTGTKFLALAPWR
ncbi:hypothetical protein DFJ58DRAFT_744828 [Suillus subalutaceus]|uniref:uncharacterized protein n=1 Tax=Suillus subalutaceus TaxID=48586 RepID=UPI001B871B3C|nr:uncharacterized protein DFJ58DRAFT_744828 [Suillus subalutaceus]KAG1858784.1 hypothetical protein DFJ58DRAFT_744828 [Suillus subalutaceus]